MIIAQRHYRTTLKRKGKYILFLAAALVVCIIPVSQKRIAAAETSTHTEKADSSKSPVGAALRSFFIPGWGQWYNEKKLKSAGVFLVETGLFSYTLYQVREYNKHGDETIHKRRNTLFWWSFFVHLASVTDAYVDAYLYRFKDKKVSVISYYPKGL